MQNNQNKKQIQQKTVQQKNIFDGIIRFCLMAVLLLVPIVFSYWYRGGYELFFPIKIFFTQIPLIAALAFFALKSIKAGEARCVRTSLNLPVLAFFAVAILSLLVSRNVPISLIDLYRTFFYVLFYFLFINYIGTKREITIILTVILVTFAVVNFYGVLQRFGVDLLAKAGGRTGVDSTLGNPDFYAGYLVAIIPVSLACIFIVKREWRVFLTILTITGIAFLFLTQSRAGFLGFFFSLLLFIFLILRTGGLRKETKLWVFSLAGIAVVLLIALSFKGGTTLSRIRESMDLKSINIRFRLLCYKSTLNIIKDHPVLGTGGGTFYNIYPKYRVPEMKEVFAFVETPRYAHNDFLQIGSEVGVPGLGVFAWLLVMFFSVGIRNLKETRDSYWRWITVGTLAGLSGMLVQMAFDFPFYRPETTLSFWAMIAMMSVFEKRQVERKFFRINIPAGARWLTGIAVVLIIPLMVKTSFDPLIGNMHYNRGLRIERRGDRAGAIQKYKLALKKEKFSDIYYTKLGTLYGEMARQTGITEEQKKEYLTGAVENFKKAVVICPYYAGYKYNLGQSYLFYALAFDRGMIDKAKEELKGAIELSSYSEAELFHNQLGLAYKEQGFLDEAIKEYEAALRINPKTIQSLINLGNACYSKGWYDKAIQTYFKAFEIDPNNVDAHNNLANAYYQKRMFIQAINEYKKALSIDPNYIDAYNNLGSVYFIAGMRLEAKAEFQKVIQFAPNSPQANYARSMLSRIP